VSGDAGGPESPTQPPGTRFGIPLRIEEVIAVGSLAVLVLLTLINVVIRYLTDESFAVTEEISVFLMVVMTMAGASAAVARDRHMRIEYFFETGSSARQRRLGLLSAWATFALFVILTLLLGRYVWDEFRYGETTMALGVPRWWYSIWLPALGLAIAGRALGLALRLARRGGADGADGADGGRQ
jgi:TRAP-type C4-dicarboxylate transport system permease small subunit